MFLFLRLGLLLLFRLGLLLLLRGLGILFVLILSVRGDDGPEKQEQNSRADKTDWFHLCCLHHRYFARPLFVRAGAIVIPIPFACTYYWPLTVTLSLRSQQAQRSTPSRYKTRS